MGMLSLEPPDRTIGRPCLFALPRSRPLLAFLPLESLHPLVSVRPGFPSVRAVGHAPAPADVFRCDLPETMAELGLLDVNNLFSMTLGAAVLPHDAAGLAFRSPVTLLQDRDGPVAPPGALQRNDVPGSDVSRRPERSDSRRNESLVHSLLQLCLRQKRLEPWRSPLSAPASRHLV